MNKEKIITNLNNIALLMELKGENAFKVRAYHNAVHSLENEMLSLAEIMDTGSLQRIKGIGKSIADIIAEMANTGESSLLNQLHAEIPPGLVEMLNIPGLGAKKIKTLYKKLHITTIEQLREACQQGDIAKLSGFAQKTQANILEGIDAMQRRKGLFLYSHAWNEAQNIIEYLQNNKSLQKISLAGSLRRHKEITKDIDILAAATDAQSLMEDFTSMAEVSKIIAHGATKSSIQIMQDLQVDLRVVDSTQFPYALMYFTGSKEHNTAMRARAKKLGFKLNEYGLFAGENIISCDDEAEIFRHLGLKYIEPELREDMGEMEKAAQGTMPDLVECGDLQGIFHVHTTYSDGRASLRKMALAAREQGYTYLGIADHSQSLTIGNGMKPDTVRKQLAEIDVLNEEFQPFRIFKGIEADILADGSLDYEDELLAQFDFVIASVHALFNMTKNDMTARVIRAINNPFTTMLGHPTGRLLLRRDAFRIDMHAVIDAAVNAGVAIEINAHPMRLDLDWRMGKYARERELLTCINPDAHDVTGFRYVNFGVGIARKAWFEKERVLNTLSCEQMVKYLATRKKKVKL